jgi:arabinose-5-phosphate isomerase
MSHVSGDNGGIESFSPVDLLLHQAEAISAAAARLDTAAFARAVELVVRCAGAVATTGAGTSGIVARKIAATLTSTGTRALFVHPSDALHGGLGVIGRREIVIAVSNSGETEEISALMPYLRSREVKIIAIVGNVDSALAREAAVALDAFAAREAGPHGLVPTASVAVALAIGDALALAVMEAKGVTRDVFVANHPSGRLGRRLTLRVRDVMHGGSEHPAIASDARLLEVLTAITEGGLGAVNILDGAEKLLGIITDGDVRRALLHCSPTDLVNLRAEEVMTHDPVVIDPEAMAYEALKLMEDRPSQIAVLPVVEHDICIGLVRLHDLIRIGL